MTWEENVRVRKSSEEYDWGKDSNLDNNVDNDTGDTITDIVDAAFLTENGRA
jgi:hypothetical protein